ncbi:CYTH domain-containing protein [Aquimarina sp. 2201CG1-2-11]|uniref:CYTH domain-containing protein n=1 Tax=Aquimarina discodermiae TaxID=3231043 RepID=UPI003461E3D7
MIEIERKFLVTSDIFIKEAQKSTRIVQGYLNSDPERAVRVRIKGDKGFLTIKGKSNNTGTSRFEWEKELKIEEAEQLLNLCEKGIIDKIRHEISMGKHIIEVDIFFGDNKGLILAEIELQHENETFVKPNWLGNEVTGDPRYYNAQLSRNPYKNW